ncbi:hypothetical protein MSAN_01950800 [Mycena sanguinolenta]|uniref:Uncharacterized protein n=1 Tax=Mycena sanguinolenta TaxID=230812 RepID=A0A8H7CMZ2_9AGAR|nr:hypothetical protein MSAN_01950800 [Mycena sanguinolenta]
MAASPRHLPPHPRALVPPTSFRIARSFTPQSSCAATSTLAIQLEPRGAQPVINVAPSRPLNVTVRLDARPAATRRSPPYLEVLQPSPSLSHSLNRAAPPHHGHPHAALYPSARHPSVAAPHQGAPPVILALYTSAAACISNVPAIERSAIVTQNVGLWINEWSGLENWMDLQPHYSKELLVRVDIVFHVLFSRYGRRPGSSPRSAVVSIRRAFMSVVLGRE